MPQLAPLQNGYADVMWACQLKWGLLNRGPLLEEVT